MKFTYGRICRHCNKLQVNRPRGLCWGCYYSPGVREMYPSTSKYARRGCRNFSGAARPTTPTSAKPWTPEKFAVLCQRAASGQQLFHELDGRL